MTYIWGKTKWVNYFITDVVKLIEKTHKSTDKILCLNLCQLLRCFIVNSGWLRLPAVVSSLRRLATIRLKSSDI